MLTWLFLSHNSWPADGLFERVNDRIKHQIERVEEMTGDMDPKTNFALIVIQTELERFKYLVRSYLRARIAKVYETTQYRLPATSTRWLTDRTVDRQAYFALSVQSGPQSTVVGDGAGLCYASPGAAAQPLPVLLPIRLPTRATKPERHRRKHQHDRHS